MQRVLFEELGFTVYAKPCLSQDNVQQNWSATGRNLGFTCHNDRKLLSNFALCSMMGGEKLEIISQIVLWYENSFRVDLFYLCLSWFELRVIQRKHIACI